MEVETPLLCSAVGTDPALDFFSTRLLPGADDRGDPLFLQTSPEFAMKRLLAAGSGSIYQICKAFRNGESGRFHNPEFSILEWYLCGAGLSALMSDIEALLGRLLWPGRVPPPPERVCYGDVFERHCGLDPFTATLADFSAFAADRGLCDAARLCGRDRTLWLELLFSHCIQAELGTERLTLVYDYPAEQAALARIRAQNPPVAERVEVFFQGMELANGFHELADAKEQQTRFQRDLALREARGQILPPLDERFLHGLEAGLPDCSGVAVGLDRLLMLITGAESIDQVLGFAVNRA